MSKNKKTKSDKDKKPADTPNEYQRDLIKSFVIGVAALVLLILWLTLQPKLSEIQPKEKVGQKLFPDFDDPLKVRALSLLRPNPETRKSDAIRLVENSGTWRIDNYFQYPADNTGQMTKVISPLLSLSVLSIRDEIDDQSDIRKIDTFHAECGLLEPEKEGHENREGTAIRLTLNGANSEKFVDLLIGNTVEQSATARDVRFVRPVGSSVVYTVDFSTAANDDTDRNQPYPDRLSTNPVDWLNRSILRISRWDIQSLAIHDFQYDAKAKKIVPVAWFNLVQDPTNSTDRAWSCREYRLPDDKGKYVAKGSLEPEKIRNDRINELADLLGRLSLTTIVPKPKSFVDILTKQKSPAELARAGKSLEEFGFEFASFDPLRPESPDPKLTGMGGELSLVMKNGIQYKLLFGKKTEQGTYLLVTAQVDSHATGAFKPLEKKVVPKGASESEQKTIAAQNKRIDEENRLRLNEYELQRTEGNRNAEEINLRLAPWFYLIDSAACDTLLPHKGNILR